MVSPPFRTGPDIRFGTFEVDLQAQEVRKNGMKVRLAGQPFQVLAILLERPGDLVTREELQKRLWPDSFVEFEHNLNTAINRIREALGDSAETPRFVETVPRRGYRFIAPVELKERYAVAIGRPETRPRNSLVWAALALAVCGTLVAGIWWFHRGSQTHSGLPAVRAPLASSSSDSSPGASATSSPALTVTPLTSYPGDEVQPSISPDGNQVAFAFNEGGGTKFHIYVKPIGSEEAVRLTSDSENDQSPSWSPDGQNIAFLRFDADHSARVMVIPSIGGAERQLARLQVGQRQSEIRVAWSPDNRWIATSDSETPNSPMSLVLISAISGEKRRLVYEPVTVDADLSPSFSPDGRYLAFARHLGPYLADIYLLELPQHGLVAPEARQLTNWNQMNKNPVWTADGQNIIFVGDHSRLGFQIWKVPAFHPGDAVSFNEIGQDSASIALSPRRNRLVYQKAVEDQNIWHIDFDSAVSASGHRRVVSQGQLIASTRLDAIPQYSPDGRYIAYQSDRSGDCEIWIARSDGTSSRQLTRLHAEISGFPRWSPDGKYIAFHSRLNGYGNIFVANVETGDYRKLTAGTTNDVAPTWSHDGKWIYFESAREDGLQIWRVPAGGGPATRLTKHGGAMALESVDGKLLFYSNDASPGLWALPLAGGSEYQVLPSLYRLSTFAVTRQGICFARRAPGSEAVISFMSFFNHATVDLASVKSPLGMGFAVSPDERTLLYTQFDRADSDLFLVENFK